MVIDKKRRTITTTQKKDFTFNFFSFDSHIFTFKKKQTNSKYIKLRRKQDAHIKNQKRNKFVILFSMISLNVLDVQR